VGWWLKGAVCKAPILRAGFQSVLHRYREAKAFRTPGTKPSWPDTKTRPPTLMACE